MSSSSLFCNKKILILSPQPWNDLLISKHHYALELAKQNDVWFICSPEKELGWGTTKEVIKEEPRLKVLHYKLPVTEKIRFHFKGLYNFINSFVVNRLLNREAASFDICIDFGAYAYYDSQNFVKATTRIFFPVDNFADLHFSPRGAQHLFTVSSVIQDRIREQGIQCHFINHGLSESFAKFAEDQLRNFKKWQPGERLKVGYSGNLFSTFLNIEVFKKTIAENEAIDFHIFGKLSYDRSNKVYDDWMKFLDSSSNVKLHGFLKTGELAAEIQKMDALMLCYQPDNKNYFGENTHKMLEYLSTGKAIISSNISLYAKSGLVEMTDEGKDGDLPVLFRRSVNNLENLNREELAKKRILMALDNTYARQIDRIAAIVEGKEASRVDYKLQREINSAEKY